MSFSGAYIFTITSASVYIFGCPGSPVPLSAIPSPELPALHPGGPGPVGSAHRAQGQLTSREGPI